MDKVKNIALLEVYEESQARELTSFLQRELNIFCSLDPPFYGTRCVEGGTEMDKVGAGYKAVHNKDARCYSLILPEGCSSIEREHLKTALDKKGIKYKDLF